MFSVGAEHFVFCLYEMGRENAACKVKGNRPTKEA